MQRIIDTKQTVLGTNQSEMRALNEKLVLTLLRRHGALSKSEITRLTGLSAQTVSVIMRQLEGDALLRKEDPVRGKIGQPSVPMSLNPEGAYFFGLKIGRRSAELILTDFVGEVLHHAAVHYAYPQVDHILAFTRSAADEILSRLSGEARARIGGLGIAMPFELWSWAQFINVDPAQMAEWETRDVARELAETYAFPIYLQNDASAACGAELIFGTSTRPSQFLYLYIGYFIGGGVVFGDRVFTGAAGNAGAIGSMPVLAKSGAQKQLIETSSIASLDARLRAKGEDTEFIWDDPKNWHKDHAKIADWVDEVAYGLAQAIIAASAVIDFEMALIDGWMPRAVLEAIVAKTQDDHRAENRAGLTPLEISQGTIGVDARPLGAASLPLAASFMTEIS